MKNREWPTSVGSLFSFVKNLNCYFASIFKCGGG